MKRTIAVVGPLVASMFVRVALGANEEAPLAPAQTAARPPPEAAPTSRDTFREPGRFGVVGAITDDGFQFGVARVEEHYEAALSADAGIAALGGSSALSGPLGDLGVTLRVGPRFWLGHLNYLSVGAQGRVPFFGKDNGVSTFGSFSVGPYVGVHRNFAGTPLLISLWVLPYAFDHELHNDGSGAQVVTDTHRFFQSGGFGLAYLF